MTDFILLLGAGFSIPAGKPSTKEITDIIIYSNDICYQTDGTFVVCGNTDKKMSPDRKVELDKIIKLIKQIYESFNSECSYEEVYEELSRIKCGDQRKSIADTSLLLICDVLRQKVLENGISGDHPYLSFLINAIKEYKKVLNIFTLNYDRVIEDYFKIQNIKCTNGFIRENDDYSCWNRKSFCEREAEVRFYRLHGSVDWFSVRKNESIEIIENTSREHINDVLRRNHMDIYDLHPRMLFGIDNKLKKYKEDDVFSVLMSEFKKSLLENRNLIVIGCSFKDVSISEEVFKWLDGGKNQLIIVNKSSEDNFKRELIKNFKEKWDFFKKEKKLIYMPEKVEEFKWKDISEKLKH